MKTKYTITVSILFIVLFLLVIFKVIPDMIPEEDYLVSIPFTTTPGWGTNFTQESIRTYDCRELVDDYWMYPKDYDEVFNLAYKVCNSSYPEFFNITREESNQSLFWDGNLSLGSLFIDPAYNFFNYNATEPAITISSNNSNSSELEPPYLVELNKDQCKEVTCECASWGCAAYCFVCDEGDASGRVNE